jgi:hypothetical protein
MIFSAVYGSLAKTTFPIPFTLQRKNSKAGEERGKAPPVEKATVKDLLEQFIPPHSSKEWKMIYNARTSAERCNKREKVDYKFVPAALLWIVFAFQCPTD